MICCIRVGIQQRSERFQGKIPTVLKRKRYDNYGPQKGNTRITGACNSPFVLCICNRIRPSSVFLKLKVDWKE